MWHGFYSRINLNHFTIHLVIFVSFNLINKKYDISFKINLWEKDQWNESIGHAKPNNKIITKIVELNKVFWIKPEIRVIVYYQVL